MSINYDFWQELWLEHKDEYLAECRQMGVQADNLSDFQVWCDDHDLVPDDEVYSNVL